MDNNFNPLPVKSAAEFIPVRDELIALLQQTREIISAGQYAQAEQTLAEGENLKVKLSTLHKLQIERMQEENGSVNLSLVYLNLLQESQELVSILRHMLRASRKFQES